MVLCFVCGRQHFFKRYRGKRNTRVDLLECWLRRRGDGAVLCWSYLMQKSTTTCISSKKYCQVWAWGSANGKDLESANQNKSSTCMCEGVDKFYHKTSIIVSLCNSTANLWYCVVRMCTRVSMSCYKSRWYEAGRTKKEKNCSAKPVNGRKAQQYLNVVMTLIANTKTADNI